MYVKPLPYGIQASLVLVLSGPRGHTGFSLPQRPGDMLRAALVPAVGLRACLRVRASALEPTMGE